MDRETGRRRLTAVTAAVAAAAAAGAALVGLTRPAPVHATPAATTGDDGRAAPRHDRDRGPGGPGGPVGQSGGSPPDAASSGS